LALTLGACATSKAVRQPASDVPELSQEKTLDFIKLTDIVKNENIETVADAIKILGERYPDHLLLRTAAYDSNSMQGATFTEPRVIVFGPTAKLVFTFNGNQDQRGGESIEVMRFDDQKKDFNFHQITFEKELKGGPVIDPDEIDFQNERVIISKSNPSACLDCHSHAKPGPVWDNFPAWRGIYGSNDDLLYSSFNKGFHYLHGKYGYLDGLKYPRSQGRSLDLSEGAVDVEVDGYLAYLKGAPSHARFKYLPPQIMEAGFRKYANRTPVDQIGEHEAIVQEGARLGLDEAERMNGVLTDLLLRLSMEQLASEIKKKPALLKRVREALGMQLIEYGVLWGAERRHLFYDYDKIVHAKLPWLAELEEKHGFYRFHVQKIIQEELELQDFKVKRFEDLFKTKLVVPSEWDNVLGNEDKTEVLNDYGRLLKRPLTRTETLGLEWESGSLPDIALLDFVLLDAGIQLSNYEINLNFEDFTRKVSLSSGGLEVLREILSK
jgi:hypothetical protein